MIFRNREEAALRLAEKLAHLRGRRPLVLAMPRGGLPMAKVVADVLDGELDVVLVRKLEAAGNPEYAVGAVDESGEVTLRPARWYERVSEPGLEAEVGRQLATLRERRRLYTPGRERLDPRGRIVVIVDEGIATGASLRAALALLRRRDPERLIAAIGVAPREAVEELEALADDVVCLATPTPFFAVAQFYDDLAPVDDDTAVSILRSRAALPVG